jgi:hypothetical protein
MAININSILTVLGVAIILSIMKGEVKKEVEE